MTRLDVSGELKAKLAKVTATPAQEHASDILNALLALGYSEKEASLAVEGRAPGIAVADGIRQALKLLAKS